MELLAVFLPLVAFAIAALFGKKIGDKGCQLVTCSAVIVAAFAAIALFADVATVSYTHLTLPTICSV